MQTDWHGYGPMRYRSAMDDDSAAHRPPPTGWLEAMEESDADLAAGRVVPLADVQAELRASIARIEDRPAGRAHEGIGAGSVSRSA